VTSEDKRWLVLARAQMAFVLSLSVAGIGLALTAIDYFGGF
jgi:hypothetical protein